MPFGNTQRLLDKPLPTPRAKDRQWLQFLAALAEKPIGEGFESEPRTVDGFGA